MSRALLSLFVLAACSDSTGTMFSSLDAAIPDAAPGRSDAATDMRRGADLGPDAHLPQPDPPDFPDAGDAGIESDAGMDAELGAPEVSAPDLGEPSEPPAGVVFETNFARDGAYSATRISRWDYEQVPNGWDGVRTNLGTIRGVPGAGVGGSVAMKFEWPGGGTALATSLGKHLTGERDTGYADLYIRYHVRLPDGFRAGRGQPLAYWKWGRLWQNTGLEGAGWTEQRPDSYYIVWNWGSGLPRWGLRTGLTFGENLNTDDRGSAGGPRGGPDWYVSGSDSPGYHIGFDGHWDSVGAGAWEFDHDDGRLLSEDQGWHTIEWHFRLSSTDTSNDGIFQVWFDGEEQVCPNVVDGIDQPTDVPSTNRSLITAAKPGMNFFTLMDNVSGWNSEWDGAAGGIWINDVVISTERIGHDYVATNDGSPF
ncbi:MAG: hypothetical protein AAF411_19075 [Myxococcota bacterium]